MSRLRRICARLYGFWLEEHDPATFVFITLRLVSVALIASFIPARRAAKIDPLIALRYE